MFRMNSNLERLYEEFGVPMGVAVQLQLPLPAWPRMIHDGSADICHEQTNAQQGEDRSRNQSAPAAGVAKEAVAEVNTQSTEDSQSARSRLNDDIHASWLEHEDCHG